MGLSKFTIYKTRGGQYYFTFESARGEIILTSEPFVFRISCLRTIEALRVASVHDYNYQQGTGTDGQHFFVVRGPDQDVLATSAFYPVLSAMLDARQTVQREAMNAILEEG